MGAMLKNKKSINQSNVLMGHFNISFICIIIYGFRFCVIYFNHRLSHLFISLFNGRDL